MCKDMDLRRFNSSFQQLHYFGKVAHVFSILFKPGKQTPKEELSSGSLGNLCLTSSSDQSHKNTSPNREAPHAHTECRS